MKSQKKKKKVYPEQSRRVFVGLSGGVDSAVSAALLKKDGYDVSGVFIKAWTPPGYPCTWKADRRSAMRAAAILDIPFVTLDLEREYKEGVVDYMIDEYRKGRTPNPDVMCNKEIKFGAFLKWAKEQKADYVATGHYTQNIDGNLIEGTDKNKDQSYFLWTLRQEQLRHILFPVGHLQKEEVRKLAKKFGLPQAVRKDSQGLCFLGQVHMKEFLSRYIEQKNGDILNQKGEIIGSHGGAVFFTIGERHGFTVTQKSPEDKPLYVVSKDIEKNIITVAPQIKPHDPKSQWEPLTLDAVNWVSDNLPQNNGLNCRLRYRQTKIPCEVREKNGEIKVSLKEKSYLTAQAGISPGQSLVLYDGDICLGGGIMR